MGKLLFWTAVALIFVWGIYVSSAAEAQASELPPHPDHVFRFNPNQRVSNIADSDGIVPEYVVCGFRALGRYSYHETASGEVVGVIRYNICAHRRIPHTVREWRATIEHERKHALGYRLGE